MAQGAARRGLKDISREDAATALARLAAASGDLTGSQELGLSAGGPGETDWDALLQTVARMTV